jgi:transcriptional regulator with XRE-family HTH domain
MATVHPLLEQLERIATKKGVTRYGIAAGLDKNVGGVYRWFTGESSITLKSLDQLANFLGVEYAIVGEDTPAADLLREVIEALSERPIDTDRVNGCIERSQALLSAGEAQ